MKSLGASNSAIVTLFISESSILAIGGGLLGFLLGGLMAKRMSLAVFNSPLTVQPALLWIILFAAVAVTLLGSLASIRRAMHIDSAVVLRGDGA